MSGTQCVFQRVEKKYLLDEVRYHALRKALDEHMTEDAYGKHTICNLYLDTADFRLIRTSMEKPIYKEKLRIRSYGIPEADGTCFVEIKKKWKGIVYKRRVELPLSEAKTWLKGEERPTVETQIHREIDWFLSFYQPEPKVYLAYDRVALFGKQDPELRVTFDQDIRWRCDDLDLTHGDSGELLLGCNQRLMEVKIPGAMPLWMVKLFAGLEIAPTSYSKYGTAYQQMLQAGKTNFIGDVFCA